MLKNASEQFNYSIEMKTPLIPANWLNKIDFINQLILLNNVLITVLAEKGEGKSTFARILKDSLDPKIIGHVINVHLEENITTNLNELYEAFHLAAHSEVSLSDLANQINERKLPVLIIIDDAQNLSPSCIKALLNQLKNQGETTFFHVCLLSDYSIIPILNKLYQELFNDMIHSVELGGLSESETKTYCHTYLKDAKSATFVFNDKQIKQFHLLTGGSICKIHQHIKEFFKPKKTKQYGLAKFAAINLVLLGILGIIIWQEPTVYHQFKKQILTKFEHPNHQTALADSEKFLASFIEPARISRIPTWTIGSHRQNFPSSPQDKMMDLAQEKEALTSGINNEAATNNFENKTRLSIIASIYSKDNIIHEELNPSILVAIPPANLVKELAQASFFESSARQVAQWSPQSLAILPIQAINSKTIATKSLFSKQFTIQVLASRNPRILKKFIITHPTAQHAKIYRTIRAGEEWFVLTLGEYGNKENAQAKISHFPNELAELKPWIRRISDLKEMG